MSFFFKSKKHQDRAVAGRDGSNASQNSINNPDARSRQLNEKTSLSLQRSTPTGSLTSIDNDLHNGSPETSSYGPPRRVGTGDQPPPPQQQLQQQQSQQALQQRNGGAPPTSAPNASLYPWSQRRLNYTSNHPSPFPRYGAAVNAISSKEGDIYIMGGLIHSSQVKGDLWLIEAGTSMACHPLATTSEGPGPRVGHSSLLVGNAFIVYGGDTKIEESDALDETLYLLNTSTRLWSRALPAGTRPSGRYGHSLNIIGSKIYVFGGQVEGHFMNDLSAFDLNQLQMPNNRWEMLIPNDPSNESAGGKIPPARTNHSMVTYNEKMYLFGGTNGYEWFNDVWSFDSTTNLWTQLDCIGYIPVPREGHAAALVDDVMYIFGGRTAEPADLGDLAAFRITSRRWYTFTNMGPSPSPRSGHSMTTVGKAVVVVGGEPSSSTNAVNDLALVYVLDTSKIQYPNDAQIQAQSQRMQGQQRRMSNAQPSAQIAARPTTRDGSNGPADGRRIMAPPVQAPVPSPAAAAATAVAVNGLKGANGATETNGAAVATTPAAQSGSRLPRAAGTTTPSGPPPTQTVQPPISAAVAAKARNASLDRIDSGRASPVTTSQNQSPILQQKEADIPITTTNGRRTPTAQVARAGSTKQTPEQVVAERPARLARTQESTDSTAEPPRGVAPPTTIVAPQVIQRPASPPPRSKQTTGSISRRSSTRNSQTVAVYKELDTARNRNAWYASELELARKAGYAPSTSLSPMLDNRAAETFDDDDKPLIEALLAMKQELANVQGSVDKQAVLAAKQIAEAERQRDSAIQEAMYAKAKMAAQTGGSAANSPRMGSEHDERSGELSRKLASALNTQKSMQAALDRINVELDNEKRARKLADETVNAAQKRMMDLENYKQQNSSELERLKAELHGAQRQAREHSLHAQEATSAMQVLQADKDQFESQYNEVVGNSKDHSMTMDSLKSALAATTDTRGHLERKLDEERGLRETIETKHMKLKAEHEARTAELVATTQRLRDAEELADRHANEANAHRQVVLAGLDKIAAKSGSSPSRADTDRAKLLQTQLDKSNDLIKQYHQEADSASDKLRAAEERIAGLEAYQEQASREGVTIRRQLQGAMRETQTQQAAASDLKNQLANQQLETNAINVQHNTLKDLLTERGISPTTAGRVRGSMISPRDSSPEQSRLRDLEKQLAIVNAAHEETKTVHATQAQESETAYREKLTQLENDYQSAVHFVKGTEKMLKQLKEQLARFKTENTRLKDEVAELQDKQDVADEANAAPEEWESERVILNNKIEGLQEENKLSAARFESQLANIRQQLAEERRAHGEASRTHDGANSRLADTQHQLEQLQQTNAHLDQRARDAEQKVSLLLDQVEQSVDTYRRRSRQAPSLGGASDPNAAGFLGNHHNATTTATNGNSNGGGLPPLATASIPPSRPLPAVATGTGHPPLGSSSSSGGVGHMNHHSHTRDESASDAGSLYAVGGLGDARNSSALDNLTNELENMRSHWETRNKDYSRFSNAFDFETPVSATAAGGAGGGAGAGFPVPSALGGGGHVQGHGHAVGGEPGHATASGTAAGKAHPLTAADDDSDADDDDDDDIGHGIVNGVGPGGLSESLADWRKRMDSESR